MPTFDFNCEVCGAARREWRRADQPPRYCSRSCHSRARLAAGFNPRKKAKYPITPEIHTRIWQVYHRGTGNGEVSALAARLGYPKWAVCRYAQKQGWVARQRKEPDWSARELQILEKNAHHCPATIQRRLGMAGFKRSVTGIVVKKTRLKLAQNYGGQSAHQVAECLGVEVHFVTAAIQRGQLRARRRGTARTPQQGGDIWFIKDEWVRDFILKYPEFIDLRKVEKFWFIDLLAGDWGAASIKKTDGIRGEVEAGQCL